MMEFLLAKIAEEGSRHKRIVSMLDHVCQRWAGDVLVLGGEATMPARLNRPAAGWHRLVYLEPAFGRRYCMCVVGSASVEAAHRFQHLVDGPIVILSPPMVAETVDPTLPPWWGAPVRVEEWNETWVLREPA